MWSSLLPRRAWRGANSICNTDGAHKLVNAYVAHFVRAGGGRVRAGEAFPDCLVAARVVFS